jgi:hypothetical protein|tara:strand:+ start:613 stop:1299 length:687 start_codon:yes stop_codon:yes gene_type:complete
MFGIKRYEMLLEEISLNNCEFSTEWTQETNPNTIFLRHDIDFSIQDALIIAEKEKKLGVKSTFFFMLTSNMYNIFSSLNQERINQIINMEHKVSIHFDPTAHLSLDPFLDEKIIFEKTFNINVDIVSIHRPGIFLKNNNQNLFDVPHTYQDRYFKNMRYISDSGGEDIQSKLNNYFADDSRVGLHLLLHPIWWTHQSPDPTSTLKRWISNQNDFFNSETELNCRAFKR